MLHALNSVSTVFGHLSQGQKRAGIGGGGLLLLLLLRAGASLWSGQPL